LETYKVSFEYLDIDETRPESDRGRNEWLDEWSGEKRRSLPWAVRMTLENPDDPRAALEIVGLILAHEHASQPPVRIR
jgi:hypothetical protein